jgi:uncharacterized OsmC-like protein
MRAHNARAIVATSATRALATAKPRLKTYSLSSTSVERLKPGCSVVTSTGHQLATDLPRIAGGDDTAAQPVELMLAALLGCKTATAHFVARNLWPRPNNRLASIVFEDVSAERDERGALAMPITDDPPVTAALLRVSGVARVRPVSTSVTAADVVALGAIVERRCPVAATLTAAGCALEIEWVLDGSEPPSSP